MRDLTTGTARTWTWRTKGEAKDGGPATLAWAPGGTHLAVGTMRAVGVLDTTAPGRTVGPPAMSNGAFLAGMDGRGSYCLAFAPAYLPGGELAAGVSCIRGGQWEPPRVAVLDPVTPRIIRTLFTTPKGAT